MVGKCEYLLGVPDRAANRVAERVPERVLANLIVGGDGSTTLGGRSAGLSSPEDRRRFHTLRAGADCILIGGNTARNEPYSATPCPLFVLTHGALPEQIAVNEKAQILPVSLARALEILEGIVLIEAGPNLIGEGLSQNLIDEFHLTITKKSSGENHINIQNFLSGYEETSRSEIGDDTFLVYELVTRINRAK